MERKEFLKKIGIGSAIVVGVGGIGAIIGKNTAPTTLKAEESTPGKKFPAVAVDMNSISHFSINGKQISPAEIMDIYNETGILFYHSGYGESPIILRGEIEAIDMKTMDPRKRYRRKWNKGIIDMGK